MTLNTQQLPYGLRDVKIAPYTDATTIGAPVDLPSSQTFSFSDTEAFTELRGDDSAVATHGNGPVVNWTLEAGGISLAAYTIMAGGTLTTTGVTPNQVKTLKKLGTDSRPYFRVWGKAISDNGGDFWAVVYRCKADGSLDGEMKDGAFWISKASGKGYPTLDTAEVYDFIQHESDTSLGSVPVNSVVPAITGTAQVAQTLTCGNGTWSNTPTVYLFQWLRCNTSGNLCTVIEGGTTNTYVVQTADVGSTLRCRVIAANASGAGASATSTATATVIA